MDEFNIVLSPIKSDVYKLGPITQRPVGVKNDIGKQVYCIRMSMVVFLCCMCATPKHLGQLFLGRWEERLMNYTKNMAWSNFVYQSKPHLRPLSLSWGCCTFYNETDKKNDVQLLP